MQRDLNVFKRLGASLPMQLMNSLLQEASEMRQENTAKHFSLRSKTNCKTFVELLFKPTLCFEVKGHIQLTVRIESNSFYRITACDGDMLIIDYHAPANVLMLDCDDESLFGEIKRICGFDVRNAHNKPSASFLNLLNEITYDYLDGNIYYKRQRAYELLAIHKFRKDSIIARLPMDVLKIVINKIF